MFCKTTFAESRSWLRTRRRIDRSGLARPSYDVWGAVIKVLIGPVGKIDAMESFLDCRDWKACRQAVQTGANG